MIEIEQVEKKIVNFYGFVNDSPPYVGTGISFAQGSEISKSEV